MKGRCFECGEQGHTSQQHRVFDNEERETENKESEMENEDKMEDDEQDDREE